MKCLILFSSKDKKSSAELAHSIVSVNIILKEFWNNSITFTTLWAYSADDKLMMIFIFFLKNEIRHFMLIFSIEDNLHKISKTVFWEK